MMPEERARPVDWSLVVADPLRVPLRVPAEDGERDIAVLAAIDELSTCVDLRALSRRAVELARERIGLERVGLFLLNDTADAMHGTWGTGLGGETLDESGIQYAVGDLDREAHRRVETGSARWLQLRDAPLISHRDGQTQVIGYSWLVITPLRSLRGAVGVLHNDAALTRSPMDPEKQVRTAVFCSLLANLIEARRAPSSPWQEPRRAELNTLTRRVIRELERDPTASNDWLATRLSVSAGHMARVFRAELGVSLVQYRNRLRIERFFHLVDREGGNLLDAALKAGFGSYVQFHRVFRALLGTAPRDYFASRRNDARSRPG